ncbi:MAG: DUF5011 domain-containing protein [Solobacterium sp.]|nr:DUF5011 domain-containing protein [Solobacterium sp.]
MLRKKKKVNYGRFYASIASAAIVSAALPAFAVLANQTTTPTHTQQELPVFELSSADVNPTETLKSAIIEQWAEADESLTIDAVSLENSKIELTNFDRNKAGLQNVTAKVSLADTTSVSYTFVQDVTIKMVKSSAPQLKLKSDEIIVNNGDTFNPTNQIAYINDDSGVLPMLSIEGDVNMTQDGLYPIVYTAIDVEGNKTTANLNVVVKTPEEVIRAREEAERLAREEAERLEQERLAEEERQRIAEEERQAQILAEQEALAQQQAAAEAAALAQAQAQPTETAAAVAPQVGGGYNPYPGSLTSNCTYAAWQLAYNATGVALPGWGNAGSWLYAAQASGYATGSAPRAGSIMVQSGHVAYVAAVSEDGNSVYIQEGNFLGTYHEAWVPAYGAVYGQGIQGYVYLP